MGPTGPLRAVQHWFIALWPHVRDAEVWPPTRSSVLATRCPRLCKNPTSGIHRAPGSPWRSRWELRRKGRDGPPADPAPSLFSASDRTPTHGGGSPRIRSAASLSQRSRSHGSTPLTSRVAHPTGRGKTSRVSGHSQKEANMCDCEHAGTSSYGSETPPGHAVRPGRIPDEQVLPLSVYRRVMPAAMTAKEPLLQQSGNAGVHPAVHGRRCCAGTLVSAHECHWCQHLRSGSSAQDAPVGADFGCSVRAHSPGRGADGIAQSVRGHLWVVRLCPHKR